MGGGVALSRTRVRAHRPARSVGRSVRPLEVQGYPGEDDQQPHASRQGFHPRDTPVTTDTWSEDDIDNIEFAVTKLSDDAAIANIVKTFSREAPDWLTQLNTVLGRQLPDPTRRYKRGHHRTASAASSSRCSSG